MAFSSPTSRAKRLSWNQRELSIYYAPVDWLWPTARIAVVGITPSAGTMVRAYQVAAATLASGRGPRAALEAVKRDAPFSGFRTRLVMRLDVLGVARHLGLETCAGALRPWWGLQSAGTPDRKLRIFARLLNQSTFECHPGRGAGRSNA